MKCSPASTAGAILGNLQRSDNLLKQFTIAIARDRENQLVRNRNAVAAAILFRAAHLVASCISPAERRFRSTNFFFSSKNINATEAICKTERRCSGENRWRASLNRSVSGGSKEAASSPAQRTASFHSGEEGAGTGRGTGF